MATAETLTIPGAALDDAAHRRMMRRAIIASATGTTIEWYDFFLYGVAAALVFPRQFFPGNDPYTGTLLAFSTYFVGFVARPFGAAPHAPLRRVVQSGTRGGQSLGCCHDVSSPPAPRASAGILQCRGGGIVAGHERIG